MNVQLLSKPLRKSSTSDEQLSARVIRALRSSGYLPLREVMVDADHGSVSLRGRVSSYYLKQCAQCVAMSVEGVQAVENDIAVL